MTTATVRSAKRSKPSTKIALGLRLDAAIVQRLDAHAERLSAVSPGLTVTRTDAVRVLLIAALDEVEAVRR